MVNNSTNISKTNLSSELIEHRKKATTHNVANPSLGFTHIKEFDVIKHDMHNDFHTLSNTNCFSVIVALCVVHRSCTWFWSQNNVQVAIDVTELEEPG
jgi:hypothetical protein